MENKTGSGFAAFVLLISDIAMLDVAFKLIGVKDSREALSLGVLPWLALAAATFLLYRLFLRRERTVPQAAGFLAGAYAVTASVLLIFFVRLPGVISYVIALLFWVVPLWHIYAMTETPPALEKLASRLEALVFVLLLALIFSAGTGNSYLHALPCAASLALTLAALVVMRTSGGETDGGGLIRGAAAVTAFLLVAAAAAAVFLFFVTDSVGSAFTAAAGAVIGALRYAFRLLGRFLSWLVSLLPSSDGGELPAANEAPSFDASGEIEGLENLGPAVVTAMLCVIAAVVAAAAVFFVIRSRRRKIGGARTVRRAYARIRKPIERRPLIRRALASVRFFIDSVIYRSTPQGVLVHLERWGRAHRRGRAVGETRRQYLMRLADGAPEMRESLARLADALDARFYGDPGRSQLQKRELASIRRAFAV